VKKRENVQNIIEKRSQFIIRKKFEIYSKVFSEILQKITKNINYKITINKFVPTLKEIFQKLQFTIKEVLNPYEVLSSKKNNNITILEETLILQKVFMFMFENRNNYNAMIKKQKNLIDDVDEFVFNSEEEGKDEESKNKEKSILTDEKNQKTNNETKSSLTILSSASKFPDSIPYLFFESIPNILYDFVSKFNQVIAIDKNDELKNQLSENFDREMLANFEKKINSNKIKIEKNHHNAVNELLEERKNLENNVVFFQEKINKNNKTTAILVEKTVEKLKENIGIIDKEIETIEINKHHVNVRPREKYKPKTVKDKIGL
jgi:hypothetical protein